MLEFTGRNKEFWQVNGNKYSIISREYFFLFGFMKLFPPSFYSTVDQYRAAGQNPGAAGKADKGNVWVVKVNFPQDFPVKP